MDRRLTPTELAALHLVSLCSTFAVVLTIIPLAILLSQVTDRASSWRSCCLWATLPCLAVFLPKSDLLFPLTCTTSQMLCLLAMNGKCRSLCAFLAGGVLWIGLMLSLAHLPVLVMIAILMTIRAVVNHRSQLSGDMFVLATMLGTIATLTVVFSWATNCNMLSVWKLNLENHEAFYSQFSRTWWKWLLLNPIELAISVGPPVFIMAALGCCWAVIDLKTTTGHTVPSSQVRIESLCAAAVVTFALLWVSGKNQGEAARLWCFLTPWTLIATAILMQTWPPDASRKIWPTVFAAQLIMAIAVVSRRERFQFLKSHLHRPSIGRK